MEKAQARQAIQERIERLSPEQRRDASECIRRHLAALPEFQQAQRVLLFVSIADEADTLPILRDALAAGKTVAVPKVNPKQKTMDARVIRDLDTGLAPGPYGIPEPQGRDGVPVEDIDFVLVPARGFDRSGNRLGRGGGYYDRYIGDPDFRAVRCGVGYAAQMLDHVPHDEHDRPVHMVVTEDGVVRCGEAVL